MRQSHKHMTGLFPDTKSPDRSGLYLIRNTVNGKVYAGSAVDFVARFKHHRRQLATGSHHCQHLQNAFTKYGPQAFVFEVFEAVSPDVLKEEEQELLDVLFDHCSPGRCYNMARNTVGNPARTVDMPTRIATAETLRGRPLTPDELAVWSRYPDLPLSKALSRYRKDQRQQAKESISHERPARHGTRKHHNPTIRHRDTGETVTAPSLRLLAHAAGIPQQRLKKLFNPNSGRTHYKGWQAVK